MLKYTSIIAISCIFIQISQCMNNDINAIELHDMYKNGDNSCSTCLIFSQNSYDSNIHPFYYGHVNQRHSAFDMFKCTHCNDNINIESLSKHSRECHQRVANRPLIVRCLRCNKEGTVLAIVTHPCPNFTAKESQVNIN